MVTTENIIYLSIGGGIILFMSIGYFFFIKYKAKKKFKDFHKLLSDSILLSDELQKRLKEVKEILQNA